MCTLFTVHSLTFALVRSRSRARRTKANTYRRERQMNLARISIQLFADTEMMTA